MTARILIEDGTVFGSLTVVGSAGRRGTQFCWACKCTCGNDVIVRSASLRNGHTKTCGKRRRHYIGKTATAFLHGKSHTPEWRSWYGMVRRCTNSKTLHYNYYGGRGITVCQRWLDSFENFLTDMGTKPSPSHSLDRIDNDGNYELANCRWATKREQITNRRTFSVLANFSDDELKDELKRRGL